MAKSDLTDRISALAAPLVEAEGLVIWGVEFSSGPRPILRLYIDSENGVTIGQCSDVSRVVGLALDVEDIIGGAYVLEVSSPGMERIFFREDQLAASLGSRLDITLKGAPEAFPRRKNFTGLLSAFDGGVFTLDLDAEGKGTEDTVMSFHWDDVKKARLQHFIPQDDARKPRKKAVPKEKKAAAGIKNGKSEGDSA